jgi:hypothetical protein
VVGRSSVGRFLLAAERYPELPDLVHDRSDGLAGIDVVAI